MNRNPCRRGALVALLALFSSGVSLSGQVAEQKPSSPSSAPPPPLDRRASDDEVFELSPFRVTSSEDSGYAARDTLAASRIRTELKDVGSSISVITKQFLEDTNSNAIENLLVYTANTEVSAEGGNFLGKGDAGILTNPPSTATRVRGLTSADNTRDLYLTSIPFDSYNTGRVDIQRGPNSILYGIGSAGGIINASVNQASYKDANRVSYQFGSYGTQRATADFNKSIIKDELAVRLSLLDEERKYRQDPTFRDDKRLFFAGRYEPRWLKSDWARTAIRVNYETGHIDSNIPRQTPPIDRVSPFFDTLVRVNGTKLQDPRATSSAIYQHGVPAAYFVTHGGNSGNAAGSIFSNSGYEYSIYSNLTNTTGTVFGANNFYRQTGLASTAEIAASTGARWYNSLGEYKSASLTDRSMFDFYNHLLEGPNKKEWNYFDTYNVTLEQTFLNDKIGFELGYDRQKNESGNEAIFNSLTYSLTVDLNTELPNGVPNPHAGQLLFVSSNGNNAWTRRDRENFRATAFAELNFNDISGRDSWLAKIFGKNVFTGLATRQELNTQGAGYMNGYANPGFASGNYARPGTNPGTFSGGTYLWGYIGGPNFDTLTSPSNLWLGGIKTLFRTPLDTATYQARNLVTNTVDNVKFDAYQNLGRDLKDILYGSSSKTWERTDSSAAVWQGYWFGGNLVPMFGVRRDKVFTGTGGTPPLMPNQAQYRSSIYDIFNSTWFAPHSTEEISQVNYTTTGNKPTYAWTSANSKTYSLVLHTPQSIRNKLPGRLGVSLFFNESENIRPQTRRDLVGNIIQNPYGKTREFGVNIAALDDKINLRLTKYKTSVLNDSVSGGLNSNFQRIAQVEVMGVIAARQQQIVGQTGDTAGRIYADEIFGRSTDGWYLTWRPDGPLLGDFSQYTQAQIDATAVKQKAAIADFLAHPTTDQFVEYNGMKTYYYQADPKPPASNTTIYSTPSTQVTIDTVSEGYEAELIARPVRGWDIAFNVSKTQATRTNPLPSFVEYISSRWAVFQGAAGTLRIEGGDTDVSQGGTTVRSRYLNDVMSGFFYFDAVSGTKAPELRPWSANLTSNYSFQNGFLKGFRVGGSYRWADKTVIGFVGTTIDGHDTYDIEHPVKGPSQEQVDLSVSYERMLTRRIKWKIQFNARNVLADDSLIPVTVQPDGRLAGYRIPEPRTFALTNSFDF